MLKEAANELRVKIESESAARKTFVVRRNMRQELVGYLQELPEGGTRVEAYVYINALQILLGPLIAIFIAVTGLVAWPRSPDGIWWGIIVLGIGVSVAQIFRYRIRSKELTNFLTETLNISDSG